MADQTNAPSIQSSDMLDFNPLENVASRNTKSLSAEDGLARNPQSLTELHEEIPRAPSDRHTISEKSHESSSEYDSE